jgi:hypothetical protein
MIEKTWRATGLASTLAVRDLALIEWGNNTAPSITKIGYWLLAMGYGLLAIGWLALPKQLQSFIDESYDDS